MGHDIWKNMFVLIDSLFSERIDYGKGLLVMIGYAWLRLLA